MLRNPRIVQLILEELRHEAGRNATEVAENLIAESCELRRVNRAIRNLGASTDAPKSNPNVTGAKD